jgi:hypothetical protein
MLTHDAESTLGSTSTIGWVVPVTRILEGDRNLRSVVAIIFGGMKCWTFVLTLCPCLCSTYDRGSQTRIRVYPLDHGTRTLEVIDPVSHSLSELENTPNKRYNYLSIVALGDHAIFSYLLLAGRNSLYIYHRYTFLWIYLNSSHNIHTHTIRSK